MQYGYLLTLVTLVLVFAACHPKEGSIYETSLPPSDQDDSHQKTEVCYPGRDGQKSCLPLGETLDPDFQYLDPSTDPSFPVGKDPNQYRRPIRLAELQSDTEYFYLTYFFQTYEVMSIRKGNYGVFSRNVIELLSALRTTLNSPLLITSGYRSPGYNSQIKGAARWSRHLYGDAIDFYSPEHSLEELGRYCVIMGASFSRLYKTHIHCDWRANPMDVVFFGEEPENSNSSKFSRSSLIDSLSQQINVSIVGDIKAGQKVILEAKMSDFAEQEDGGELLVQWMIVHPAGETEMATQDKVTLELKKGTYQIEVKLGGTTKKTVSFSVES